MATTPSVQRNKEQVIVVYAALGNETGDWVDVREYADKTLTVYGTGTVTVEGSPDASHAVGLKDQSGTTISLVVAAAAASSYILENTPYIRVKNTSATGVLAIIVGNK